MYLGVDVGGTKTLVAALDDNGVIIEKDRFLTPKHYADFPKKLENSLNHFMTRDFKAGAIGLPGRIDRKNGRLLLAANLSWRNIPAQADCEKIGGCPMAVENDANLAGLSESMLEPKHDKILYITIGTGIGTGVVYKRHLEPAFADIEGGNIILPYKDKLVQWEKFASGKAIYKHFGQYAADIPVSDTKAWRYIARNLVAGFYANIAIVEPDLIIVGGGIGTYFKNYSKYLEAELEHHRLPVVKLPKIVQAKRPEEAVLFGCYDLAKQVYGHDKTH